MAEFTFRVPNESTRASTTQVRISLPTRTPFAAVRVRAVSGWKTRLTTKKLAKPLTVGDFSFDTVVTAATWTASSVTAIKPGQYEKFGIMVDGVPATEAINFPVTQTYSDGAVVRWNEPMPADGGEAEHPMPTIALGPQGSDPMSMSDHNQSPSGSDASDVLARTFAITALALSFIALIIAATIWNRTYSTSGGRS